MWAEAFGTLKIIHFEFVFFPVDKVVASVLKGHPGASIGGTVCGKNMMGKKLSAVFCQGKNSTVWPFKDKKTDFQSRNAFPVASMMPTL